VSVSTGRVVDFRLKDALRWEPEQGTSPFVYPCQFNGGTVHWPQPEARKPNAIRKSGWEEKDLRRRRKDDKNKVAPVTSKPAGQGRVETGHSEVLNPWRKT
jgi:hypothetical protein